MRILILGAGATGGYFGGRFAEAGADVTFLVRPQRAARLRANGLRIFSPFGDMARPAAVVTAETVRPDFDLIVLSCKAWDLQDAITAIRPIVTSDTRLLPLLNGMRHLDLLDAAFGEPAVLGGFCQIAAVLAADGSIRHLNRIHLFVFGPRTLGQEPFCRRLFDTLARAAVELRTSEAIVLEMWEKWVSITALAGATCLMRAAVGDIVAAPGGEATIEGMLEEAASVARACGYSPRPEPLARFRALFTERGSSFTASMLRDIEADNPIEAHHIFGNFLDRARAANVATPLLSLAYCHLKAYEARRARTAARAEP